MIHLQPKLRLQSLLLKNPQLPNIVYKHMVDYEKWNHMDSLVAKDAHTLVYPYIFEQMEQYKS